MVRIMAVAGAAVVLSISGIFTSPALAAGTTWHVQAGSIGFESPDVIIGGGNQFYPKSIAIHPGDSVAFTPVGPHTVTYNRPPGPLFVLFGPFGVSTLSTTGDRVNSGIIGEGPPPQPAFTVTFASTLPAGLYNFICGLHVGMSETIEVLPMSQALPHTDAQYGAIAQREITRDLESLAEIASEARQNDEDEDDGPSVLVGAGNKRVSNLRFFPQTTTIRVGQTISFLKKQDPTEPHTVTFGPENPDQFLQLVPEGGNTYNGSGTVNSGLLMTKEQYAYYQLAGTPGIPVALTKFRLTFTRAGTYQYICALHDGVGMVGTVIVRP
jgi:plastocyanin